MPSLTQMNEFECCLQRALKFFVAHELGGQIFESTKDCAVYINESVESFDFKSKVINSYFHGAENTTLKCDVINDSGVCSEPTRSWYLAYFVFWIVVLSVGVIANMLVLFVFYQSKTLRKNVTNYFIVSLACSDLLGIMFTVPYKAYLTLHNHYFCAPAGVCNMYFTTDITFFTASITNLFVIAIDRYLAVTKPYRYKKIVNKKRARIVISVIWIYSCLWGAFVNFDFKTLRFNAVHVKYHVCTVINGMETLVEFVMVFYIPSIIMLLLYAKILKVTFSHANHIETIHRSVNIQNRRKSSGPLQLLSDSKFFINKRLELRATQVVVVVYGTFMVCWLPVIIIVTVNALNTNFVVSKTVFIVFGEMLPLINSILNPFIYSIMHRDYKIGLKQIFRKFVSKTFHLKTTDFFTKQSSRSSMNLKSPESDGFLNNEILNIVIKEELEEELEEMHENNMKQANHNNKQTNKCIEISQLRL